MERLKLKYDGRWDWYETQENRQWTVLSHYKDATGRDCFKGSFSLEDLQRIGIVKTAQAVRS
jgi:hypothetical protein